MGPRPPPRVEINCRKWTYCTFYDVTIITHTHTLVITALIKKLCGGRGATTDRASKYLLSFEALYVLKPLHQQFPNNYRSNEQFLGVTVCVCTRRYTHTTTDLECIRTVSTPRAKTTEPIISHHPKIARSRLNPPDTSNRQRTTKHVDFDMKQLNMTTLYLYFT